MKLKLTRWLTAVLMCASGVALDTPRGTVPKSAADQYPAHTVQDGINIGHVLGPLGSSSSSLVKLAIYSS